MAEKKDPIGSTGPKLTHLGPKLRITKDFLGKLAEKKDRIGSTGPKLTHLGPKLRIT